MKCEIIKDLIPLSGEGLCSEESENQIMEHIKSCEKCRLLYETSAVNTEPLTTLPEAPPQKNIFKKVNKKLKRHRIIDIILILLIAVIISILGYLTYGQIAKNPGCQSFETIFQTIEVRKIANAIAEGDSEEVMKSLYTGYENQFYTIGHAEKIRANDVEAFNNAFEKAFSGRIVKDVHVSSDYVEYELIDGNFSQVFSTIEITFDTGRPFTIELVKNTDGRYTNSYQGITLYHSDEATPEEIALYDFKNVISFAGSHDIISESLSGGMFSHQITRDTPNNDTRCNSISLRFNLDCREDVYNNALSYYENGYTVDGFIISESKFDSEMNLFYHNICLTGEDELGSAVMQTRLYFNHTGLYSPDSEDITIYSNGCTPELEEALRNFFG